MRRPTARSHGIITCGIFPCYRLPFSKARHIIDQCTRYRQFALRLLTQRHPYSIAYTLRQKSSYTYSRLYASILGISGFRYSKMQWIVHILSIHSTNQAAHRLHHHHHVRCLNGYHHIVEIIFAAHTQELHGTLHHSGRSIAITAHYTVRQRPMVHTYTYSRTMLLTEFQKWGQRFVHTFNLSLIFRIGIFNLTERTAGIHKIAGVDTYFLHLLRGGKCRTGIKMDIGNQRHIASRIPQPGAYLTQIFSFTYPLGSKAYIFGSGIGNTQSLCHRRISIHGRGRCHGLYSNRIVSAKPSTAHIHFGGITALIIKR